MSYYMVQAEHGKTRAKIKKARVCFWSHLDKGNISCTHFFRDHEAIESRRTFTGKLFLDAKTFYFRKCYL